MKPLYGRRQGRPLGKIRQEAMDSLLPLMQLPSLSLTQEGKAEPSSLFSRPFETYWLEIGFGHGEHVHALSRQNSDTGYLTAEPFVNGMAAFLKDVKDVKDVDKNAAAPDNIKVLMDDGMIIARSLTPNSLDGIYILNPDPWHKKRHHKRRIINQQNLDIFARILKPKGQLVMTSDVEDLANWMCTHTNNHPAFEWQAHSKDDWSNPPKDWLPTRYEQKGAKGSKKMVYLFFKRK